MPIVESGISIHTLTPTNFISIDIYSCKKYSMKVKNFKKRFSPKEIEEKFFSGVKSIYTLTKEILKINRSTYIFSKRFF